MVGAVGSSVGRPVGIRVGYRGHRAIANSTELYLSGRSANAMANQARILIGRTEVGETVGAVGWMVGFHP